MPGMTCPHCRGDAEPSVVPEALGRHGNARVRLTGLPAMRCTYCQKSAPRYDEFVTDTARVVALLNSLPTATKIGLFKKQPACCQCKAPLQGAETGPVNFDGDLEIVDPPFHVDLSILATTCPQCETQQVVLQADPIEVDIEKAIARAMESVAVSAAV